MPVPSTSWEFEMQLVEFLRGNIDKWRELKLQVTELRNVATSPEERRKLEHYRCLLSLMEKDQIRLYKEVVPEQMLTVN